MVSNPFIAFIAQQFFETDFCLEKNKTHIPFQYVEISLKMCSSVNIIDEITNGINCAYPSSSD